MIWMLGGTLEPVIYLVVWSVVARSQGGEVAGMGERDFAAYYLVLYLVNHFTFSWIMQVFQFRIQEGSLSFELLRPLHPIHSDIADNVAYKIVMMVVLIPSAVTIWLVFNPRFEVVPWSLALFALSLPMGFAVRFLFEWSLALSAFWTTRVDAINRAYFSVSMFLSGRVAPIVLLPPWLRSAAAGLPFFSMVGFPVELALGRLTLEQALWGMAIQLFWILFGLTLIASLWRVATKRFTAVGS